MILNLLCSKINKNQKVGIILISDIQILEHLSIIALASSSYIDGLSHLKSYCMEKIKTYFIFIMFNV